VAGLPETPASSSRNSEVAQARIQGAEFSLQSSDIQLSDSEIAMAFGSKRKLVDRSDVEEADADEVDLNNSGDEHNSVDDASDEEDESTEHGTAKAAKSLLDEVFFLDAPKGKNSGGSRPWRCKHCDKKYTSSCTRIRQHFFGVGPGKTKQISCCSVANDRIKYKKTYDKYHQPEKGQASGSVPTKQLLEAFAGMERDAVDMQIMLFLCANGIPFNVLRSPQYYEMVAAIQSLRGLWMSKRHSLLPSSQASGRNW